MSSLSVVILSKSPCVQCTSTYRSLDKTDIAYEVRDITTAQNLALAGELGYSMAPVGLAHDEDGRVVRHWSGFRPDIIAELKNDPATVRREMPQLLAA